MLVRTLFGIGAIISIIVGIILLATILGGINVVDYNTQVAVGLTLLGAGIVYWIIKPFIVKKIEALMVVPTASSSETQEQGGASSVSQVVGTPNSIEDKVKHYNTRDELPRFGELLALAHKKIEMSALTFYIVTLQHIGDIETAVNREIKITLLLLNPNSRYVQKHAQSLHAGQDMKYQIEKSLALLCDLRKRLDSHLKKKIVKKNIRL